MSQSELPTAPQHGIGLQHRQITDQHIDVTPPEAGSDKLPLADIGGASDTNAEDRMLGQPTMGAPATTPTVRPPDPPRASVDLEPAVVDDPRDFEAPSASTNAQR